MKFLAELSHSSLTRAETTKILGSPRNDISSQRHFDSSSILTSDFDVKEDNRVIFKPSSLNVLFCACTAAHLESFLCFDLVVTPKVAPVAHKNDPHAVAHPTSNKIENLTSQLIG